MIRFAESMKCASGIIIAFCLIVVCLPPDTFGQENASRYRVQVKALDRAKLDSLKIVCDNIARRFGMSAYILDQDNYYKIAVGDFYTFSQASEKLNLLRDAYHDAWIIPSSGEFIIYPESREQLQEKSVEEPLKEEIADDAGDDLPAPEKVEIPEPQPEEVKPVVVPEVPEEIIPDLPDHDMVLPGSEPEGLKKRKLFFRLYGTGVFIDLHAATPDTRYCTYYGYGVGADLLFAFTKNIAFDLSTGFSLAYARPVFEKHDLSGNASVLKIAPSLLVGTNLYSRNGIYGKLGLGYFNYDYAYSLELKPGYSGGPASVDTELLERASAYGLDFGIGIRVFKRLDLSFITWLDPNSRRLHSLNLGIVL